jgi:hypothetical protein
VGAAVACTALTTVLIATVPDWHGNSVGRQCSFSLAAALLTAVPLLLIANGVVWMAIAARTGVVLAAMCSALIAGAAVLTATSAADRCTSVSTPPPLHVVAPTPEVHPLGPGPTASACGGPASNRRIAAGSWSSCDELRFGFAIDSFGNELDDLVMNIQTCYPVIEGEGITIYPRASEIEPCLTAASAGLDAAYAKSAPALARYLPKRTGPCRDAIELYTRDVLESWAYAGLARRKVADGDVRGSYAAATRLLNRYAMFTLDRVNIQSACIRQ